MSAQKHISFIIMCAFIIIGPANKAQSTQLAEPVLSVQIAGSVLDDQNNPLADVNIKVSTVLLKRMFGWEIAETSTDPSGQFQLAIPFAEIPYFLYATKMGYLQEVTTFIPCQVDLLQVRLKPIPQSQPIRGAVVSPQGQGVPNATIKLIVYNGYSATTKTNNYGRFEFDPINYYISQAVPVVKINGLVAPLQIVRSGDNNVMLVLDKPAQLEGVVRDKDDGMPIADADVIIRPGFYSDFRIKTTSAEDGTFEITDIPPGEYHLMGFSPTCFNRPPRVSLSVGETRFVTIEMQRAAVVRGCLINPNGEPVTNAIVGIRMPFQSDFYRDQHQYVFTDNKGRFAISTGHLNVQLPLAVYSAQSGLATTNLEPLSAGQELGNIIIRLPGAARIRGVVTDPNGRPIQHVVSSSEQHLLISDRTDAKGQFDLGRVSAKTIRGAGLVVQFNAPRPRGPGYGGIGYYHIDRRDTAPQFFHHKRLHLNPKTNGDIYLKVVLEPAELLEITGTVVDTDADPVPDANVYLLTGDAKEQTWLKTVNPPIFGEYETHGILLATTCTNKNGKWRFWTVRENRSLSMGSRKTDWSKYCIGVLVSNERDVLVRNVVVPEEKIRKELTIRLERKQPLNFESQKPGKTINK